jgi:hypothetical protein
MSRQKKNTLFMENVMKKFLPLFALMVAMAFAAPTKAATISFDLNFGPIAVSTANGVIGSLSNFDPDLGTLTNVQLDLEVATTGNTVDFDNEGGSGGPVTLGIGGTVTAQDAGANLSALVADPAQINMGTVDPDNDGAADFIGTDSLSVTGGVGMDSDSTNSSAGGVLAAFTGPNGAPGTFDVNLGSILNTSVIASGPFGPTQTTEGTISGTITVTYTYNDGIPTPAALPAGLALMGMLGLRRRRA